MGNFPQVILWQKRMPDRRYIVSLATEASDFREKVQPFLLVGANE